MSSAEPPADPNPGKAGGFEPELLLAEHPILFSMPDRLSEIGSWHQHIPFAFWCIAALRPKLVVELGTHKGDSYLAFCQAVDRLATGARCHAIDSWKGDAHTHAYGPEVLAELRAYHDPRYGRFSTLLQARFEDAARWFANGSIDLLHIDGEHSIAAVRRDYERWLPKLSPRAVVLFHDITVQRQGFGVQRIWDELAGEHPSLAFHYGHGLGALAPGETPPAAFLDLVQLGGERRRRLERLFHYLGRAVAAHGARQRAEAALLKPVSSQPTLFQPVPTAEAAAAESARRIAAEHDRREEQAERSRVIADLAATRAANMDLQRGAMDQAIALHRRDVAFRAGARRLHPDPGAVPAVEAEPPAATILVPVHDGWHLTLACLEAIRAAPTQVSHEIIVLDDHSTDGTYEHLRLRDDIKLLRNPRNLGYLRSCNEGARHAAGRFLVLLNNDTLVEPGWLDELVGTFDSVPEAGLVGAKLVYPDGRLQEAGGILWHDGSGWNYGRGDDPDRPDYCYRRDVDYCSAACIALPTALWRSLGGFDERYAPAYYEDSDLAMRVRAAGRRVIYQPLARVVHAEGSSHGTDESRGLKARQVVNQRQFQQRWNGILAGHGEPATALPWACERKASLHVLVIDAHVPTPDRDAGSIITLALIRLLQDAGYRVTFHAAHHPVRVPGYTDALQRIGVECLYEPYVKSLQDHLEAKGERYDLVLGIRYNVLEPYIADLRRMAHRAPIAFLVADLHFLRAEREAELLQEAEPRRQAAEIRRRELSVIGAADCTIVHSTVEQTLLAELVPEARTYCFPWIADAPGTEAGFEERSGVMFLGGYNHPPNVDAVLHFVAEILPLLRQAIPGIVFYVVGSHPPRLLLELQSEHVVVTGQVGDLRPWFDRCRVSVAPLRYGAGVKGKVITAMSHGLPVVASSTAAEGIGVRHEEDLLIGTSPAEQADLIIRVYRDAALWRRLSQAGQRFVEREYSHAAGERHMDAILALTGAPARRS